MKNRLFIRQPLPNVWCAPMVFNASGYWSEILVYFYIIHRAFFCTHSCANTNKRQSYFRLFAVNVCMRVCGRADICKYERLIYARLLWFVGFPIPASIYSSNHSLICDNTFYGIHLSSFFDKMWLSPTFHGIHRILFGLFSLISYSSLDVEEQNDNMIKYSVLYIHYII